MIINYISDETAGSGRMTPEPTSFFSVMLGDAKLSQSKSLVTSSSLNRSNNTSFSSLEPAKPEQKSSSLNRSSNVSLATLDGAKSTEQDSMKQSETSMSISGQNLVGVTNPASLKLPSLSQPKPYSPPLTRAPVNQAKEDTPTSGITRPKLKSELALARSTFYGLTDPSPTSETPEKESYPFKEDKDQKQYFV